MIWNTQTWGCVVVLLVTLMSEENYDNFYAKLSVILTSLLIKTKIVAFIWLTLPYLHQPLKKSQLKSRKKMS